MPVAAAHVAAIAAAVRRTYHVDPANCRYVVISSLRERYLVDNSHPRSPPKHGDDHPPIRFHVLGTLELNRTGVGELRALLVQPKRLALFAYLVLANPSRLHRRDSLLPLFWPESNEEQARRSLRQALHFLRQAVGSDVLSSRGDDEIGVDPGAVWCDARRFESALDGGRPEEAVDLYRGHLLEGFHVSGVAPELDQWLEGERSRLRTRAASAVRSLAEAAERSGNARLAVQRVRELLRIEESDEGALRRLMMLLERSGDRSGALRAYEEFARTLRADLETEPSSETIALADRLRAGVDTTGVTSGSVASSGGHAGDMLPSADTGHGPEFGGVPQAPPGSEAKPDDPWKRRSIRLAAASLLIGALVVATVALWTRGESRATAPAAMVLAVGSVEDRTGADSMASGRVMRALLATELARISGISVVSQARMEEIVTRISADRETPAALTRAAAAAGAADVLEGELYRRSPDTLRLDLRLVHIATGVTRRAYTVEAPDLFALVERVSGVFATELGVPPPAPALSDLTTTSLVARRFYEEGVRGFYQGDRVGASRLFRAALAEDSTFAMAALFVARAEPGAAFDFLGQAVRMSPRATERERLLIATAWAEITNHPSLLALAESVAVRYPLDPEADYALGRALVWSGDFSRATAAFRRAITRDSISMRMPVGGARQGGDRQPPCTACAALTGVIWAYNAIDSLGAAERAARDWVRRQPGSPDAWYNLGAILGVQGRAGEALDAWRTRQTLVPGSLPDDGLERAFIAIRTGNFAEADRLLTERARDGAKPVREEALWRQLISLRTQGRLAEALAVAIRYREEFENGLPMAQVLFESGRPAEAARLFERHATRSGEALSVRPDSVPGLYARTLVWPLTHAAAAYAAAGDTANLARLADTVAVLVVHSAYGRDRVLHHHLRGLQLTARGEREAAAAAFRLAIYSPTIGYTRTNLELGRVLVALGRPRDAAAVLAPALRGDMQASNYYVTHAELHEALAEALEAAGDADSARVHYAWVARAWSRGDPEFRERAERSRVKSR